MTRTLVVYFSRTGYTRKIAEQIADRCGADVEAVRDVRSRKGVFGYLRSAREALKKRAVDIQPAKRNPAEYDLIILGTPVWASNLSSPMRSYIAAQRRRLPRVAFFCTQGGSGAAKVLGEMGTLCGRQPVATLALTDGEIKKGAYGDKLDAFLEATSLPKAAA